MTVRDIYNAIDAFAPFLAQEKWDNSGLLVGDNRQAVNKVLVTLDISCGALLKAEQEKCDVIVSHHPVIFSPLKSIGSDSIVYELCRQGIAAICCHTPLDVADGGLNDLLADRLCSVLKVEDVAPLMIGEPGRILTLQKALPCAEIASAAKNVLGCTSVRYTGEVSVKRLGICTGSGSSLLEEIEGSCDCLLTGDVKHDRWYKAQELEMGLIDCGHYHTEILMVLYVAEKLRKAHPTLEVVEFVEGDPVSYV